MISWAHGPRQHDHIFGAEGLGGSHGRREPSPARPSGTRARSRRRPLVRGYGSGAWSHARCRRSPSPWYRSPRTRAPRVRRRKSADSGQYSSQVSHSSVSASPKPSIPGPSHGSGQSPRTGRCSNVERARPSARARTGPTTNRSAASIAIAATRRRPGGLTPDTLPARHAARPARTDDRYGGRRGTRESSRSWGGVAIGT